MRSLATRPGYVARDYIEGKRKSYVGPVAALVITVGLAGLVTLIFGMQWFAQVDEVPARYVLQEHMNVVIMFQVPLLALLCWMFFWKEGLHYAEHLVFAAYTAAFRVLFLACIEIPLLWLLGLTTATLILYIVYVSFWLAYFSFAASQFYRGNRAWSAVKAVCVAVASQGLTILAVSWVLLRALQTGFLRSSGEISPH